MWSSDSPKFILKTAKNRVTQVLSHLCIWLLDDSLDNHMLDSTIIIAYIINFIGV